MDGAEQFFDLRSVTSNQNPSDRFVIANPDVSGRFAYNTNAPVFRSTNVAAYNYTHYDNSSSPFSITLNSESGETGQFSIPDDNNLHQTSVYSSFTQNRQSFDIRGSSISPNLNLTGSTSNCFGEMGCFGDGYYNVNVSLNDNNALLSSDLAERFPEVFGDVVSFDLEIFSYDNNQVAAPELNLKAGSMSVGLGFDGLDNLPTDASLPKSLPNLNKTKFSSFNLNFYSESYQAQTDVHVSSIILADGSQPSIDLEDNGKAIKIEEFLSSATIDSYVTVNYSLSDLSLIADGLTSDTPLLPKNNPSSGDGFEFTFETRNDGEFTFIDPDVAVGYDYEVSSGSTFVSVLLPENIGDNQYDLWLFDSDLGEFVDSDVDLTGGVAYAFEQDGLSLFRILGIETDELIDPNDPFSFVTGLKFADLGATVNMSQKAISQFVPATVPVPSALILFLSGIIGLFVQQRKI